MEKQKLRSEIDDKYKWDLEAFMKESDIEANIKEIKELTDKVVSYQNKIMESAKTLLEFEKIYTDLDRKLSNLIIFVFMDYDTDMTDSKKQNLRIKLETLEEEISNKLSFVIPEILKQDYSLFEKYMKEEKELEFYKFDMEKVYRYKEHTLSKEEERIITLASNAMGTPDKVFSHIDNTDVHFSTITVDGKEIELTNGNYYVFLKHNDQNVRKQAFHTLYEYFKSLKNTLAASLYGSIKETTFFSEVKKFNSALEASLFNDNIETEVYDNLIKIVNENMKVMYKYFEVRKKLLNLDELHMYDLSVPLVKEEKETINLDEGKEIILKALSPLGEEYINALNKAFEEKWIDFYPSKGKKSGAYSWGTYDSYPYLMLNYDNTLSSVSTLAHELGHSMHSYFSNKTQEYLYHSYPIFLAEIASTVNEVLLSDYLYKNAKTKDEKILYLSEFLDKVRTTLYRQTMFAEFEKMVFEKYKEGTPLTEEEFSNTYYELNKKYYGDNVVSDEDIKYEWSRIPHFYTPFYVYKYATGISSAILIASEILKGNEDMKKSYMEFLKSGGSNYPLEILSKTGIDIKSGDAIKKAIKYAEEKLKELKELI